MKTRPIRANFPVCVICAGLMFLTGLLVPMPAQAGDVAVGVMNKCQALSLSCSIMGGCQCVKLKTECNEDIAPELFEAWTKNCNDKAKAVRPQGQCTELERTVRFKSEEMRKTRERWNGIEDDYLAFYDASKVSMQADFDKVYYELPNALPFSGSINMLVKVETNQRLRHMPSIKIKRTSGSLSKFQKFLTIAKDLSGLIPGNSLLAEAATVSGWLTFWADKKLEKEMPYDEGVAKFREIMKERQVTLDNYRRFINQFFCKKLLKLEHDIFTMRTKTVPQSQCAPNVKAAMDGWLARHTAFNNETNLKSMDKYCASF